MPRQFGQSALAFALQNALNQGGQQVSAIPQLKLSNLAFANDLQNSQLSRMIRQAAEERAQKRFTAQMEDRALAKNERDRQRDAALRQSRIEEDKSLIQQRNLAQLADSEGLLGNQVAGAGFTPGALIQLLREKRLRETQASSGGQGPIRRTLTPTQTGTQVDKRIKTQESDLLNQLPAEVFSGGGLDPRALDKAVQEGLDKTTGGFLGFGRSPAPDSSLFKLREQLNALGSPANRAATADSLPILRPDIFGGAGAPQQAQGDISDFNFDDELQALRGRGLTSVPPQVAEAYRAMGVPESVIERMNQQLNANNR